MTDNARDAEPFYGMNEDDPGDDADMESEFHAEAEVACPHCGEVVSITLDPQGGASQVYTEDCEVCCQPWLVRVRFDPEGNPQIRVEQSQ